MTSKKMKQLLTQKPNRTASIAGTGHPSCKSWWRKTALRPSLMTS